MRRRALGDMASGARGRGRARGINKALRIYNIVQPDRELRFRAVHMAQRAIPRVVWRPLNVHRGVTNRGKVVVTSVESDYRVAAAIRDHVHPEVDAMDHEWKRDTLRRCSLVRGILSDGAGRCIRGGWVVAKRAIFRLITQAAVL